MTLPKSLYHSKVEDEVGFWIHWMDENTEGNKEKQRPKLTVGQGWWAQVWGLDYPLNSWLLAVYLRQTASLPQASVTLPVKWVVMALTRVLHTASMDLPSAALSTAGPMVLQRN